MNDSEEVWWREFTEQEIEWYRLWFEFLKISDKTEWSNAVAHDFDIDYFKDEFCSFEEWWPDHQYLFWKIEMTAIEEITSAQHYEAAKDDGSLPEGPVVVAIFLHMWVTKTELRAAFEEILKKYHKGKSGRPEFQGDGDCYNLYARPDTDMLKKILAVYKANKNPENIGMSLWQIEEEASKETPVIDKTSKFATYLWKQPQSDLSLDIIEARKNVQCITVSRYLKCAEDILKNVVEGRFPVYEINPINVNK